MSAAKVHLPVPVRERAVRKIKIARTDKELRATYDVMRQLRPNIKKSSYLRLVKTLRSEVGFQIAVLTEDNEIICVAGFRICDNLGWGRYLYVDDMVTDKRHRSSGAGRDMLRSLIEIARRRQCLELRLDSKLSRHAAHRFYLRERMDIIAFHFRLSL